MLDDTGTIGDLNGLFFDVLDDSLVAGLSVTGTDLTGDAIKANSVTKVDSYNNVNGEVVKETGKFDVGVQFGTQGMSADDIQSTSFILSHDSQALTLDFIAEQDVAVRLTSVGTIDGSRDDSVKISGTTGAVPEEEPPVPEDPEGEDPVCAILADDFTFALAQDGSNPFGTDILGFDPETGEPILSVLENDINADGTPYEGPIYTVTGDLISEPVQLSGSDGGLLILYPDGSVDFIANDAFNHLQQGETAQTTFSYAVECGATADIVVTVEWQDPDLGGGIGF